MNFGVIITDEMSDLEKNSAIASYLAQQYEALTRTPEWKLLADGLEAKADRMTRALVASVTTDQRQEDRDRGYIAAIPDFLATATKARLLAEQLEHQAANDKERTNARERADRGEYGHELGALPGYAHLAGAGSDAGR